MICSTIPQTFEGKAYELELDLVAIGTVDFGARLDAGAATAL